MSTKGLAMEGPNSGKRYVDSLANLKIAVYMFIHIYVI